MAGWSVKQLSKELKKALKDVPSINLLDLKMLDKEGEGGVGTVWKVQSRKTGEILAIKTIELAKLREQFTEVALSKMVTETIREIYLLSESTNHKCFPALHGVSVGKERLVIVMEYLEGQELLAYHPSIQWTEPGHWELFQRWKIMQRLALCLATLHDAGLAHRDLKPENIRVVQRGGWLEPRLVDFGSACILQASLHQAKPDLKRFICGPDYARTLLYLAPEQWEAWFSGSQSIPSFEKSDVFAMGLILFWLLTGIPPYDPSLVEAEDQRQWKQIYYDRVGLYDQFSQGKSLILQWVPGHDQALVSQIYDRILETLQPDPANRPRIRDISLFLGDLEEEVGQPVPMRPELDLGPIEEELGSPMSESPLDTPLSSTGTMVIHPSPRESRVSSSGDLVLRTRPPSRSPAPRLSSDLVLRRRSEVFPTVDEGELEMPLFEEQSPESSPPFLSGGDSPLVSREEDTQAGFGERRPTSPRLQTRITPRLGSLQSEHRRRREEEREWLRREESLQRRQEGAWQRAHFQTPPLPKEISLPDEPLLQTREYERLNREIEEEKKKLAETRQRIRAEMRQEEIQKKKAEIEEGRQRLHQEGRAREKEDRRYQRLLKKEEKARQREERFGEKVAVREERRERKRAQQRQREKEARRQAEIDEKWAEFAETTRRLKEGRKALEKEAREHQRRFETDEKERTKRERVRQKLLKQQEKEKAEFARQKRDLLARMEKTVRPEEKERIAEEKRYLGDPMQIISRFSTRRDRTMEPPLVQRVSRRPRRSGRGMAEMERASSLYRDEWGYEGGKQRLLRAKTRPFANMQLRSIARRLPPPPPPPRRESRKRVEI